MPASRTASTAGVRISLESLRSAVSSRSGSPESMSASLVTSSAQHAGARSGDRRDCPLRPDVGRARARRTGARHGRLPPVTPGPAPTTTCASGSRGSARRVVSTSSRTVPATSGPGGVTPTRPRRRHRLAPRLGARRRGLRRAAGRRQCARGRRRAAQQRGLEPDVPLGVVNFVDEEGARFGVACAGSRIITGALDADRARSLTDVDGVTMAEAWRAAGRDPDSLGADPEARRPHRPLRRAARRAGQGPRARSRRQRRPQRPVPRRRHRHRHLAARPLARRPAGRGQPRRHDPHRGPP